MIDKNSWIFGLLLGAITPVIGFVVVEYIFDLLISVGWMPEAGISGSSRRYRTMLLLALMSILIPFHFAKNKRWDETMRGIMIPTLIYVCAWVYKFFIHEMI
jgi:amino acid permease